MGWRTSPTQAPLPLLPWPMDVACGSSGTLRAGLCLDKGQTSGLISAGSSAAGGQPPAPGASAMAGLPGAGNASSAWIPLCWRGLRCPGLLHVRAGGARPRRYIRQALPDPAGQPCELGVSRSRMASRTSRPFRPRARVAFPTLPVGKPGTLHAGDPLATVCRPSSPDGTRRLQV